MLILSATPCSRFISTPRVSYSSASSSSSASFYSASYVSLKLNSNSTRYILRRKWHCPCLVVHQSKARGMSASELVEEKKDSAVNPAVVALSSGEEDEEDEEETMEKKHSRMFLDARSEEELIACISKEAEAGTLPSTVASGMKELYENYRNAVFQSGDPKADEIILSNMTVAFDRMFLDVKDPFVFSPHHKAMREPFDYYMFGQNYIRPLIDFRNSYVGNISLFYEMEQKLQQGHNIVLISNHQTEADPAVIALLLENTNSHIAENVAYIAGDRVLTDPLCKPFSMGRNLICVYSKKHMHDVPELAEMKRRANTRSLKEMTLLLRGGSQIIWIAPSGGRDRPDPSTEEWYPASFDASAVDNIRRLAEHSGVPGHVYPLALLCHDIMPPPLQVEKEIGEKRVVSFHGTGLSVAPEINYFEIASASETPEEAKDAYTQALYNSVTQQYNVLKSAIHGQQGLEASTSSISLSQPWK